MHGLRSGVYGLGLEVWGMRFGDWIQGLGLDFRCGVWGLGSGVEGLGCGVWWL